MTHRTASRRSAPSTARKGSSRPDAHAVITAAVIEAIERGETTSGMPWAGATALPTKASDGTPYRGVNVLHLWAVAGLRGYVSPVWGGFRTWLAAGGHVRRGERGTVVVYAGAIEEPDTTADPTRSGDTRVRRFARSFTVFNRDQVDGLPDDESSPVPTGEPLGSDDLAAVTRIDAFAAGLGARVHRVGTAAYLDRRADAITVPPVERFVGTRTSTPGVGYASTLAHELVHWSAHAGRAAREIEPGRIGYAREELVAELGAAYLAPELGFGYCGVADHAGYIAGWLKLLREDDRAIARASAQASSAATWLLDRESSSIDSGVAGHG